MPQHIIARKMAVEAVMFYGRRECMNVLVTGGYGFVGMHVVRRLLADGNTVFIFDKLPKVHPSTEKSFAGAIGVQGDILDQKALFGAVETHKIDQIVHLAALRTNDSQENPYLAFKVNCEGFMNCLEAVRLFALERLVYASSVSVLGSFRYYCDLGYHGERLYKLTENSAAQPTNVYGATKLFDELMGSQYASIFGIRVIGTRLPIVYGAGKKSGSKTSCFNDMIEQAYYGNPLTVDMREDWFNITYVKDAAKGVCCAASAQNPQSGVYHTGGHTVNMAGFADTIKRVLPGANITLRKLEHPVENINTCVDISAAERELGYIPDFTLEQGIMDHLRVVVGNRQL